MHNISNYILPATIIAIGVVIVAVSRANKTATTPRPTTTWTRYRKDNS